MSARAASPAYIIFQLAAAIALDRIVCRVWFRRPSTGPMQAESNQANSSCPGPDRRHPGTPGELPGASGRDCEGAHPKEVREMTAVSRDYSPVHGKAACHVCGRAHNTVSSVEPLRRLRRSH
jgi:hypothetical protein